MKEKVQQVASSLGFPYGLLMVLIVIVLLVISPIIFLFGGFYLYLWWIKRGNLKSILNSISLFFGITYLWAKVFSIMLMVISSPLIIVFSLLLLMLLVFKETLNEKELSKMAKEKRDWSRSNYNKNLKIHRM